ncbi:hypothetical protein AB2D30_33875, partial [Pseudomonas aeruginosa]
APSGIVGLVEQLAAKFRPARKPVAEPAIAAAHVDAAILETHNAAGLDVTDLSISFGGVRAVQGVSFRAAPGAVTSII